MLMCFLSQMGSTQSVYVANGSRHKVIVYDKKSTPNQSVTVSIGDAIEVPRTFEILSIVLCDGQNTQAISNWKTKANKPNSGHMSIIITEEGCVELGYSDERAAKYWMWISRPNDINHRPTKSFVANASGGIITTRAAVSLYGECIIIHDRDTATIEYEDAIITCDDTKFPVKPKPRTSTIVFPDHIKVTGQLYGGNIEEEKWIVDGVNYKPEMQIGRVDRRRSPVG